MPFYSCKNIQFATSNLDTQLVAHISTISAAAGMQSGAVLMHSFCFCCLYCFFFSSLVVSVGFIGFALLLVPLGFSW